jgi:hypothetical protein
MVLSCKAKAALQRIRALRQLPTCASATRAETKILENLTLQDVSDVALVLNWDDDYDNKKNCMVEVNDLEECMQEFEPSLLKDKEVPRG